MVTTRESIDKDPQNSTAGSMSSRTSGDEPTTAGYARDPDGTPRPRSAGPYRLLDQIGRGGMGIVYQAYDPRLDRHVALKFLPWQLADPSLVERFFAEAKAASALDHPNICTVFDIGQNDKGQFYFAMAYYEGETLARKIARGPLAIDETLELSLQAATGLSRAHEAGIIHRDIKPANLMVTERRGPDRLKILDFGVAKLEGTQVTDPGLTPGTLVYMPPEQLDAKDVDTRADLWSLGVVIFEMLTGQRPFDGPQPVSVMRAILQEKPRSLRSLRPDIPRSLERLVEKTLAKNPAERHASATELIEDLEDVQQEIAPVLTEGTSPALMTLVTLALGDDVTEEAAFELLEEYGGRRIGDDTGRCLLFTRPWKAVSWALACQRSLAAAGAGACIGIHLAEVLHRLDEEPRINRAALDLAERLGALALERQILLTRGAFDLARQAADGRPSWLAHGAYGLAGEEESIEIFEVGEKVLAPLAPPEGDSRSHEDAILGWRPAAGQTIAARPHWRLTRKLGAGGFGEVWLATHTKTGDRHAFKFCFEASRLRGLKREITLFRLLKNELGERNDITRILDWNFDTVPYFIESEYTEGGDLEEWAEKRGGLEAIPLETRLGIVTEIAEALSAAHSVGVLHKDVKPGNILIRVESLGQPHAQLADFGIGLLTDETRLLDSGITMLGAATSLTPTTDAGSGTPLYRAPELLEGKAATVQADIYALGVVLYQMVLGDFQRALGPGWERDVDDELLREDIQASVDKSPRRRLGNAMSLAERLETLDERRRRRAAEQWAAEEAERTRRELERSRQRRKVTAVVIVVLTIFASILAWQVHRATREAERANREAETARQVTDFLVGVFEVADPGSGLGGEVTAREILERGSNLVGHELRGEPEVRARLLRTIGLVYRALGLYDNAQEHFDEALAIRRLLWGPDHMEIAQSLDDLAHLSLTQTNRERAQTLAVEALEMRRRLFPEDHPEVATGLFTLAVVQQTRGNYDDAESLFRQTLTLRRRILGEDHHDIARSLNGLAMTLWFQRSYEEAESLEREALEMRRSLLGDQHRDVAESLINLAQILRFQGKYAEAADFARQALQVRQELFGAGSHPEIARTLKTLGDLAAALEDPEEAEELYRQALEINRQLVGDVHPYTAANLVSLGRLLREVGKYDESRQAYLEALRIREQKYGEGNEQVASCLMHLGRLEHFAGDFAAAETFYDRALRIFRQIENRGLRVIQVQELFARVLRDKGDGAAAEAMLLEHYQNLKEQRGETHEWTQAARRALRIFYEEQGDAEKAAAYGDPPP